jgi:hypothetical protein
VTGGSSTSFIVRYLDDRAIKNRSINYGDIQVTGPNGFVQTAAFYGVDVNANGPIRDVTYFVSAPGGRWDFLENGTYVIHVDADQVFDVAGNPVAPVVIGSFTVNVPPIQTRPPDDMTELNASDWFAFAVSATATTTDDLVRKTSGTGSVRFDTTGGFDTFLRYEPPSGTLWNLTDASQFQFDVYAENPSPFDFQQEPIVRFIDEDGDAVEFRYWQNNSPYPLWNNAIGTWRSQVIFIKSTAQPATGWRGTAFGTPDWSRMRTVEIHADTWDAGFTLWFDRMGFNLPAAGAAVSLPNIDLIRRDVVMFFDAPAAGVAALPRNELEYERATLADSDSRRAAFFALLGSHAVELADRYNDAPFVNIRQDAVDEESEHGDARSVFDDLPLNLFEQWSGGTVR